KAVDVDQIVVGLGEPAPQIDPTPNAAGKGHAASIIRRRRAARCEHGQKLQGFTRFEPSVRAVPSLRRDTRGYNDALFGKILRRPAGRDDFRPVRIADEAYGPIGM